VVAIYTTPSQEADRKTSLQRWTKRTQEVLAFRSQHGGSFDRLYNLFRTKRLVEVALDGVLQNEGAVTAGVDGVTRKTLGGHPDRYQRLRDEIWRELSTKTYQPAPVRRVYIPKANGEQRALGIPTIKDRAVQEMLRLVLEPIYEAKFYGHSYGFRPFRSTHHAAVRIKDLMGRRGYNWAIEGDIRKCFDRIHHAKLLNILRNTIQDERIIRLVRSMLVAGVMEDGAWHVSGEGTPQGGIVSPLLANIYLNELDTFIASKWHLLPNKEQQRQRRTGVARPCFLVRYADDFVVMVKGTEEQAKELKAEIAEFLWLELHLELSESKTLVTPATMGVDFLGFHIRKFAHAALIVPSRKAMDNFRKVVTARIWEGFSEGDVAGVVGTNRYIVGWGMYYRRVSSARAFRKLDRFVWQRVWRTTLRLRSPRGRRRPAQHYGRHHVRYRFDNNKKNRWRGGGHYGVWANKERSAAYIVAKLSFLPIRYVDFHPQLNPYIPEERAQLEARRNLQGFLAELQLNQSKVNQEFGSEWSAIRKASLKAAGYECQRCGRSVSGRTGQVQHRHPEQPVRFRSKAFLLGHFIVLCPTCQRAGAEGQPGMLLL
jgi:group II intron reverse transcriptase/maturase